MKIRVQDEGFQEKILLFDSSGFWTGQKFFLDGQRVQVKKGTALIENDFGIECVLEVKQRIGGMDPVPDIKIDGREIELAPKLEWYQLVWMGLPLLLLFTGGAVGILFGFTALGVNATIFRSKLRPAIKYWASGCISLGATTVMVLLATLLEVVLK